MRINAPVASHARATGLIEGFGDIFPPGTPKNRLPPSLV